MTPEARSDHARESDRPPTLTSLLWHVWKNNEQGPKPRPPAESSEFSGKRNPGRAPNSCSDRGAGVNLHPVVSTKRVGIWSYWSTSHTPSHPPETLHSQMPGGDKKKKKKSATALSRLSGLPQEVQLKLPISFAKGAGKSDWGCNHFKLLAKSVQRMTKCSLSIRYLIWERRGDSGESLDSNKDARECRKALPQHRLEQAYNPRPTTGS